MAGNYSPGAFPIPHHWLVRELLEIRNGGQVILGPLSGIVNEKGPYIRGEYFEQYCANTLTSPAILDYGEDHPWEYDLEALDTPYTTQFQQG